MDREDWDARYGGDELLWHAEPNRFLVAELSDRPLAPGRVLDVACGEGRNAIWLAEQGWQATGVDFSGIALAKGRRLASQRGVTVEWVEADVTGWDPPVAAFDLLAVFYLQLPSAARGDVYGRMARGLAPGGTMLVVGHDTDNLTEGYGGPKDAAVLYTPEEVAADLGAAGLKIVKAERVRRAVDTDEGPREAIDALVRAVA